MKKLNTELQKIAALAAVSKGNKTLPICTTFLIPPETISATDLEVTITIDNPFNTTGCGLVEGIDFQKIHKNSKSIDNIIFDNGSARIVTDAGEFTLKSNLDYQDFPILNRESFNNIGSIDLSEHEKTFKFAESLASKDPLREKFNGIYFDSENSYMVSTDAHRMLYEKFNSHTLEKSFVLSRKAFPYIEPKEYEISQNDTLKRYRTKGITITVRQDLQDDSYINWQAVIPEDCSTNVAEYDTKEFVKLVTAALITANSTNKTELRSNGSLIRSCDLDKNRSFKNYIKGISKIEGEICDIGFNGKFMLELLKYCGDTFTLSTTEPNRALIIDNKMLLMPTLLENK